MQTRRHEGYLGTTRTGGGAGVRTGVYGVVPVPALAHGCIVFYLLHCNQRNLIYAKRKRKKERQKDCGAWVERNLEHPSTVDNIDCVRIAWVPK